jgi:hypothetical protein
MDFIHFANYVQKLLLRFLLSHMYSMYHVKLNSTTIAYASSDQGLGGAREYFYRTMAVEGRRESNRDAAYTVLESCIA